MKIGELAKATGLAPSRIRFYEAEGLIGRAPRKDNGYRDYPPEAALSLKLIERAQQLGFSLAQIRRVLPQGEEKWDHRGLVESLEERVAGIRLLQRQLEENIAQINDLIVGIESRPDGITCQENMQRVMELMQFDIPSPGRDDQ